MTTDTPTSRLNAFLKAYPSVQYLRLVYTDYSGVQRSKAITIHRALQLAEKANVLQPGDETPSEGDQPHGTGEDANGVVHGSPTFVRPLATLSDLMGRMTLTLAEDGDDCAQIDWTSLRPILSDSKYGYAAISLYSVGPFGKDSLGYTRDPRVVLRKVVGRAKEQCGMDFLVGHEMEFVLLDRSDLSRPLPGPTSVYGNVYGGRGMAIVEEIVASLEHAGVHVWSFHPEDGEEGQFELQLTPLSPLESCDQISFAIHIARSVANKHGCVASLQVTPLPSPKTTIGRHIHLSHSPNEQQDYFRAGLVHHLPQMAAILSSTDSFTSRKPFLGRGWAYWSQNKAAPIHNKAPGRFEVRVADAHFNIYLQLASIIVAGLDGVQNKIEISQKEAMPCGETIKFWRSDDDSKACSDFVDKYKLDIKMPADVGAALENLKGAEVRTVFESWMGVEVVECIIQGQTRMWEKRHDTEKEPRRIKMLDTL